MHYRQADARDSWAVAGKYPGGSYARLAFGLYVPAAASADAEQRLRAWQLVLPSSAGFSHVTAVAAYGWWTPPLPAGVPLFVAMSEKQSRPRRPELHVTRHPTEPAWREVRGLRVTDPGETLLACARDLRLLDLVAICDSALHAGACTMDELRNAASRTRRGAPMLRKALRHLDGRAESGWESMLRMLHVLCGVKVESQVVVADDQGRFVARGDLHLRGTRRLHEFDGSDHRLPAQHRRDLARERRLSAAGWTRHGYTAHEVVSQGGMILRDADEATGRQHDPRRIRVWHRRLAESLVTPAGLARFAHRLSLDSLATPGG